MNGGLQRWMDGNKAVNGGGIADCSGGWTA